MFMDKFAKVIADFHGNGLAAKVVENFIPKSDLYILDFINIFASKALANLPAVREA